MKGEGGFGLGGFLGGGGRGFEGGGFCCEVGLIFRWLWNLSLRGAYCHA